MRATTGAAPVPVPPPSPAVMKTMSEPRSSVLMRRSPPSPRQRPLVGIRARAEPARDRRAPIWSVTCASEDCSDCASVLNGDELDAGDPGLDHAVDGVDAAAADADDAQQG